ncbi:MAG: hypothetical protein AB1736_05380, partial [Chloroflexota bacterium]
MTRTISPGDLEHELSARLATSEARRPTTVKRGHRGHGRARARFAGLLGVGALMLAGISGAFAVHDVDFQLEGNVEAADLSFVDIDDVGGGQPVLTPGTLTGTFAGPYDWDSIFTNALANRDPLPGDFTSADATVDFLTDDEGTPGDPTDDTFDVSDPTTFTGGSSKDINDISEWKCVGANQVTNKGDLINVYAAISDDGSERILYFGAEKYAGNGDNNVGIWLLQNPLSCPPGASGNGVNFTGAHTEGDLFMVAEITNGGGVSSIIAYEWVDDVDPLDGDPDDPGINQNPVLVSGDCLDAVGGGDLLCAVTNGEEINVPWPHFTDNSTEPNGLYDPVATIEGGINLSAFPEFANRCFTGFLFNTRSSQELTAELYDWAKGDINTCDANVSIAASGTNQVDTPHTFTITANAIGTIVPNSITLDASVSPAPDSFDETDCATPTISNGGKTATCEVVINDAQTGVFTVNATATFNYDGGFTLVRDTDPATVTIGAGPGGSGPATKTYVDARISIQTDGTNQVGDEHTFTVTVEKDLGDGGGWVAASGVV